MCTQIWRSQSWRRHTVRQGKACMCDLPACLQAQRFSAKKAVYENCVMLSREGEMLCHTDRKKLEWYLSKGIAEKVGL